MNNELQCHRISNINTYKVRSHFPRLVGKSAFRNEHACGGEFIVKEIIADQRARGRGLLPGLFYHQGLETDDRMILGKSVPDVFDSDKGVVDISLSTFDPALHDLAGSTSDIPCYKMFGDKGVGTVPVYDTLIYFDDISPDRKPGGITKILEECQYGCDYGYRAFKLRIGHALMWVNWADGLKRDIDVTRTVRERFPDYEILVDANDAYTVEKVRQYVDEVADVGLYWIREPFRKNEQDFRVLREHLDAKSPRTLTADGETDPNTDLLIDLYKGGLLGVFQIDIQGDYTLGYAFGLIPWRRVMLKFEEIGARISPHAWGLKLKTYYAVRFCVGYPSIARVEGVTDTTEGVDFSSYKLKDDKMYFPEKSGFGMDFIWGMPLTDGDCESKTICRQVWNNIYIKKGCYTKQKHMERKHVQRGKIIEREGYENSRRDTERISGNGHPSGSDVRSGA